jgi:hypothetical protein
MVAEALGLGGMRIAGDDMSPKRHWFDLKGRKIVRSPPPAPTDIQTVRSQNLADSVFVITEATHFTPPAFLQWYDWVSKRTATTAKPNAYQKLQAHHLYREGSQ